MSETTGEKLIKRATEAEAQVFEAISGAMAAYDRGLEVAIRQHSIATAGLYGRRHDEWKKLSVKHGLSDRRSYGIRRIDGRPYIVELPDEEGGTA